MRSLILTLLLATAAGAEDNQHAMSMHRIPDLCPAPNLVATRPGAWGNAATWTPARVPGPGDAVLVAADVSLDGQAAARCITVAEGATLRFRPDAAVELRVRTVAVLGSLEVGTLAVPARAAALTIVDAPLDLVTDPEQFGGGVIVVGSVTAAGVPRAGFARVALEPLRGATSVVLAAAPVGWSPGDLVVVPETRQRLRSKAKPPWVWPDLEERAVVSVAGAEVRLSAPLAADHRGARDDGQLVALPHVANLTRSVVFRSESPAGSRGHFMAMHRARVLLSGAEFRDLGRTTVAPLDSFDSYTRTPGTNQIGRYPVHLHHLAGPSVPLTDVPECRMAPLAAGCSAIIVGCAVVNTTDTDSRHGIVVHHSSNVLVKGNVTYGTAGTGYMLEDGFEHNNLLAGNLAWKLKGSGDDIAERTSAAHYERGDVGHEGVGFWTLGQSNHFRDNVVAMAASAGFASLDRYPDKKTGAFRVPARPGEDVSMGVGGQVLYSPPDFAKLEDVDIPYCPGRYASLLSFSGNEVYASRRGIEWWNAIAGAEHRMDRFLGWHLHAQGVFFKYASRWTLADFHLVNDAAYATMPRKSNNQTVGIDLFGGYVHQFRVLNPRIAGFYIGIAPPQQSLEVVGGELACWSGLLDGHCGRGTQCSTIPQAVNLVDVRFRLPKGQLVDGRPAVAVEMDLARVGLTPGEMTDEELGNHHVRLLRPIVNGARVPSADLYFERGAPPGAVKAPHVLGLVAPLPDDAPALEVWQPAVRCPR